MHILLALLAVLAPVVGLTPAEVDAALHGQIPVRIDQQPGGKFHWTFRATQGEGQADAQGIITVAGLKITSEPATLGIRK